MPCIAPRFPRLRPARTWRAGLAWLLGALAASFGVSHVQGESGAPSPSGWTASPSGPWGELAYTRILLEPPEEFLAEDYVTADAVRWVFPGYTIDSLQQVWQRAGLSDAERGHLSDHTAMDAASGALVVTPSADIVLSLSPAARTVVYTALSLHAQNPDQNEPYRFRADLADEWFAASGLAPETLSLVRRLLYRRGNSVLFSDQDMVLPKLPSPGERRRLVKTLARKSTLLVQLQIRPESNVDALASYWAVGPRRKDVHALLQSLTLRPNGALIDIAHLLPRFPRSHLFSYPSASDHAGDANFDCHWTSLNFFNDPPNDRFANTEYVQDTLENDYVVVTGTPLLGDVLVFFRGDGKAIHSCVYIAANIVFTKNGASQMMPWMLMDLRDVVAFYPADPPVTVRAFRRKGL